MLLSVFFLRLMKYSPAPPKFSLICHDQSSLHQMEHCVQSFGSDFILAAAEKTSHCCNVSLRRRGRRRRTGKRRRRNILVEKAVSSRACLGVMVVLVYWVQICPEVWGESGGESAFWLESLGYWEVIQPRIMLSLKWSKQQEMCWAVLVWLFKCKQGH